MLKQHQLVKKKSSKHGATSPDPHGASLSPQKRGEQQLGVINEEYKLQTPSSHFPVQRKSTSRSRHTDYARTTTFVSQQPNVLKKQHTSRRKHHRKRRDSLGSNRSPKSKAVSPSSKHKSTADGVQRDYARQHSYRQHTHRKRTKSKIPQILVNEGDDNSEQSQKLQYQLNSNDDIDRSQINNMTPINMRKGKSENRDQLNLSSSLANNKQIQHLLAVNKPQLGEIQSNAGIVNRQLSMRSHVRRQSFRKGSTTEVLNLIHPVRRKLSDERKMERQDTFQKRRHTNKQFQYASKAERDAYKDLDLFSKETSGLSRKHTISDVVSRMQTLGKNRENPRETYESMSSESIESTIKSQSQISRGGAEEKQQSSPHQIISTNTLSIPQQKEQKLTKMSVQNSNLNMSQQSKLSHFQPTKNTLYPQMEVNLKSFHKQMTTRNQAKTLLKEKREKNKRFNKIQRLNHFESIIRDNEDDALMGGFEVFSTAQLKNRGNNYHKKSSGSNRQSIDKDSQKHPPQQHHAQQDLAQQKQELAQKSKFMTPLPTNQQNLQQQSLPFDFRSDPNLDAKSISKQIKLSTMDQQYSFQRSITDVRDKQGTTLKRDSTINSNKKEASQKADTINSSKTQQTTSGGGAIGQFLRKLTMPKQKKTFERQKTHVGRIEQKTKSNFEDSYKNNSDTPSNQDYSSRNLMPDTARPDDSKSVRDTNKQHPKVVKMGSEDSMNPNFGLSLKEDEVQLDGFSAAAVGFPALIDKDTIYTPGDIVDDLDQSQRNAGQLKVNNVVVHSEFHSQQSEDQYKEKEQSEDREGQIELKANVNNNQQISESTITPQTLDNKIYNEIDENRRKVHRHFLCYPEDNIKKGWDVFTSIILVAACFMTPFGLAFKWLDEYEGDQIFIFNNNWNTIESIIDIAFIVEIIVCFNSSYYDEQIKNEYVTSRYQIAKQYISGWFWIDLFAVLPRFLRELEGENESNQGWLFKVLGFLKVARIGRLVKLLRLLKMAKTLKQKSKMQKHMQTKMRLNVAKERLLIFSVFAILFVHTISCLWIFLGAYNINDDPNVTSQNWIEAFDYDISDMSGMYTIGLYWTITTITTVGYGDISATNMAERIVACIIMVIGVIAFSFSTGSLSSIIQNVDSRQAAYRQRLDVLKELRVNYGLENNLYMELNAFINFQSQQRHQERDDFINELPDRLRYRVSELLYVEYKKKIHFFQQVQYNSNFIAWLCPNLKPLEVIEGALVQVEQEKLTCISFIKQGSAAYVSQRCNNQPYVMIEEGEHFGVLDIVFRCREVRKRQMKRREEKKQLRQEKYGRGEDDSSFSFSQTDSSSDSSSEEENFAAMSSKIKCKFTVRAMQTCYLLQMEKQALEKMIIEFPEIWTGLVKEELGICGAIILKKAYLIRHWERKKKQDMLSQQNQRDAFNGISVDQISEKSDDSYDSDSSRQDSDSIEAAEEQFSSSQFTESVKTISQHSQKKNKTQSGDMAAMDLVAQIQKIGGAASLTEKEQKSGSLLQSIPSANSATEPIKNAKQKIGEPIKNNQQLEHQFTTTLKHIRDLQAVQEEYSADEISSIKLKDERIDQSSDSIADIRHAKTVVHLQNNKGNTDFADDQCSPASILSMKKSTTNKYPNKKRKSNKDKEVEITISHCRTLKPLSSTINTKNLDDPNNPNNLLLLQPKKEKQKSVSKKKPDNLSNESSVVTPPSSCSDNSSRQHNIYGSNKSSKLSVNGLENLAAEGLSQRLSVPRLSNPTVSKSSNLLDPLSIRSLSSYSQKSIGSQKATQKKASAEQEAFMPIANPVLNNRRRQSLVPVLRQKPKFQKILDEDERMFMEDFKLDMRNDKMAEKEAKNLTKPRKSVKKDSHYYRKATKATKLLKQMSNYTKTDSNSNSISPPRRQSLRLNSLSSIKGIDSKKFQIINSTSDPSSNVGLLARDFTIQPNEINLDDEQLNNQLSIINVQQDGGSIQQTKLWQSSSAGAADFSPFDHNNTNATKQITKPLIDVQLDPNVLQNNLILSSNVIGSSLNTEPAVGKQNDLRQLVETSKQLHDSLEMIIKKVSTMQETVSNVKSDQERLMRKSNQIRSGLSTTNRKIDQMSGSVASSGAQRRESQLTNPKSNTILEQINDESSKKLNSLNSSQPPTADGFRLNQNNTKRLSLRQQSHNNDNTNTTLQLDLQTNSGLSDITKMNQQEQKSPLKNLEEIKKGEQTTQLQLQKSKNLSNNKLTIVDLQVQPEVEPRQTMSGNTNSKSNQKMITDNFYNSDQEEDAPAPTNGNQLNEELKMQAQQQP